MDVARMPAQDGEKGHPEYEWEAGEDLQGQFVQVFFQLVRGDNPKVFEQFGSILRKNYDEHLRDLCKALVIHTRDCVEGKGERDLAYGLLMEWYKVDPEFAKRAFVYWIYGPLGSSPSSPSPPPGSWKDVVNLCNYIKNKDKDKETDNHPMIAFVLELMAKQILVDDAALSSSSSSSPSPLSLVGKWAPRESSKQNRKWFYRLSQILHPYEKTEKPMAYKSYRKTRKMLATLNRAIDTMEIKQCGKQWSEIGIQKVPSVAFQKQKRALMNLPRMKYNRDQEYGGMRYEEEDRIQCSKNMAEFIEKSKTGEVEVKAKHAALYDLVRDAMFNGNTKEEHEILEEQWKKNGDIVRPGLPPMIPMVDVSPSMSVDKNTPLYNAIGLGLRASEKTHPVFQNRILTFSTEPEWVVFRENASFYSRVHQLHKASWGMTTDFYAALNLILKQMVELAVPAEEVSELVLAIFSDMQMDAADKNTTERRKALLEDMRERFEDAGYTMPHILFWNLRSTNGFPCVTTAENVTMLSGFNQVLLNALENKGMEELKTYTPIRMIREMLSKPRFNIE